MTTCSAISAGLIPSLYPANAREILEYGLLGYTMSGVTGMAARQGLLRLFAH